MKKLMAGLLALSLGMVTVPEASLAAHGHGHGGHPHGSHAGHAGRIGHVGHGGVRNFAIGHNRMHAANWNGRHGHNHWQGSSWRGIHWRGNGWYGGDWGGWGWHRHHHHWWWWYFACWRHGWWTGSGYACGPDAYYGYDDY